MIGYLRARFGHGQKTCFELTGALRDFFWSLEIHVREGEKWIL